MQPELPVVNWLLSDPSSYRVWHGQQLNIIKWRQDISDWPWQALKVQISYMKKWPKCPWFPFLHFLSPNLYLLLHDEFSTISWQEERLIWFIDSFVLTQVLHLKWKALALLFLSGTSLKNSAEGKFSSLGRTLRSAPGNSLFLAEKMARCATVYRFIC